MSDIEKELRACQEGVGADVEMETARIYNILTKFPMKIKKSLQCFIYDNPLTKPFRKDYSSIDNEDID